MKLLLALTKQLYHCRSCANLSSDVRRVTQTALKYGERWRIYSTDSKQDAATESLKTVVNRQKFRTVEDRLKEKGYTVLKDIQKGRDKVREKVEEIIERENIYTVPNLLCITRIAASPYLGLLIIQSRFDYALMLLGVAAVTDLLDGWVARTWTSQASRIGSFLDPMADKVLIATLFLSLTYVDLIPLLLTEIVVARDVLLIIAGFVIRYMSLPPPRTFTRYFDATHATAQLAPTFISKINTGIQLLYVGTTLAAPVFHYVGNPLLEYLCYITGATTVAAGLSYILSRDTYRLLKKSYGKK